MRDRVEEYLPLNIPPCEVGARFGAGGWVVDTVPMALYCAQFIAEQPLEAVIAQAIEASGDTDTIASITGQIIGAVVGVPYEYEQYFSRIDGGQEAVEVAEHFADFLSKRHPD